jgi:hypothetical protein
MNVEQPISVASSRMAREIEVRHADTIFKLATFLFLFSMPGGAQVTDPETSAAPPRNLNNIHISVNNLGDIWKFTNFGNFFQSSAGDYHADRISKLNESEQGSNRSDISFETRFSTLYVTNRTVTGRCERVIGVPAEMSVLIDSENLDKATWSAYVPNFTLTLPDQDGKHAVWVVLRGLNRDFSPAWSHTQLTLDRVAPTITITNPILAGSACTVRKPYLQLEGFADEEVGARTYDLANANGVVTGKDLPVVGFYFDTSKFDYTTNYFHAYDIPLALGLNTITLHLSDWAGNVAVRTIGVTLNYAGATNPPVMQVLWPPAGSEICGSTFYIRGKISDETAKVVGQSLNGQNPDIRYQGIVERDGTFWVENLPLNRGVNKWLLIATDAAGNQSTLTLSVVKSPLDLVITSTPEGKDLWEYSGTVVGTISDPTYSVSVNGVSATVTQNPDGTGTWSADNVPNYGTGTVTYDVTATPKRSGASSATPK